MTSVDDPSTQGTRAAPAASAAGAAEVAPIRFAALHFGTSQVFFVLGAAALARSATALSAGSFSSPGVIAAFHLLTLGWIGTWLMGESARLLATEMEAPLRWEGLGYASFGAWTAGTAAFAAGMAASVPSVYLAGGGVLGIGALLFAANLWASLSRAPSRDLTWWCLGGSALFLLAGWLLGLLLAVNLTAGILGTTRYSVLAVHLHLAAGGWVLLSMIGLSHRLLPRLLDSRGVPAWPTRLAAGLTGFGAILLLASEHILPVGVVRTGLWAMGGGTLAFGLQVGLHLIRRREEPGASLGLANAGVSGLILAAGAGGALLSSGIPEADLATTYGLLLVPAGMALFAAGIQGRVLGLLAERNGVSVGPGPAGAGALLLAGGGAALATGALLDGRSLVLGGGLAYTAGALLTALRFLPPAWRLVRRRAAE